MSKYLGQGLFHLRFIFLERHKYCRHISLPTLFLHLEFVYSYDILIKSFTDRLLPSGLRENCALGYVVRLPEQCSGISYSRTTNQSHRSISGRKHQDSTSDHVYKSLTRISCTHRMWVRLADIPRYVELSEPKCNSHQTTAQFVSHLPSNRTQYGYIIDQPARLRSLLNKRETHPKAVKLSQMLSAYTNNIDPPASTWSATRIMPEPGAPVSERPVPGVLLSLREYG
jgi:hypothetical protein